MSISQKERYKQKPAIKGYKRPDFKRNSKKKVKSINLITNEELVFDSIELAKDYFKVGLSSIYQCCLGYRNSVNKIKFQYII